MNPIAPEQHLGKEILSSVNVLDYFLFMLAVETFRKSNKTSLSNFDWLYIWWTAKTASLGDFLSETPAGNAIAKRQARK